MQLSVGLLTVLRLLATDGTVALDTLLTLDQRPLRACYYRGWFRFDRNGDGAITSEGLAAWEQCHGDVKTRVNSTNPMFAHPGRVHRRVRLHGKRDRVKV